MTRSPKQSGFFMPAEWQKHEATLIVWPYDPITFPKDRLEKVENTYCSIIEKLHRKEKIQLLLLNEQMQKRALHLLQKTKRIDFSQIEWILTDYADVWIRDYGPTYLLHADNKQRTFVKWIFNSYGNKFLDLLKDDKVVCAIQEILTKDNIFTADFVMEGGAIEVNGKAAVLTTEECLLNPNRNPHLDKKQVEELLCFYLGVSQVLWLPQGITNDHTDGHIDELARFVDANTILVGYEEDPEDPNFAITHTSYDILQKAKNLQGKPFRIKKMPMPHMFYDDGQKAPASYMNFYIANDLVLVPQFQDKNDQKALQVLQELFPFHEVAGIDATHLIYGGGTIHCITQQIPCY